MTNRDAALLAFKVLGLWLMASAATGLAGIPQYWQPQYEGARAIGVLSAMLPPLVAVGIGVPLWFSAGWFAERIFPGATLESAGSGGVRAERMFALALSILGALFICEAIPALVNGVAFFVQSRTAGASVLGSEVASQKLLWNASVKASIASGLARLLVGAGLLAGPAGIAAAVMRIRSELAGPLVEVGQEDRKE